MKNKEKIIEILKDNTEIGFFDDEFSHDCILVGDSSDFEILADEIDLLYTKPTRPSEEEIEDIFSGFATSSDFYGDTFMSMEDFKHFMENQDFTQHQRPNKTNV